MGTQARRTESGVAAPGTDVMVEVKVDISSLKANVENIRVDVSELREDFKGLREEAKESREDVKRDIAHLDAKLDTKVDDLGRRQERDFRVLFGTIISGVLALGGLIAKALGWLH